MTGLIPGAPGVELSLQRSPVDDALVLQIGTTEESGHLRVKLNDDVIWNRDPVLGAAMAEEIAEDVISSLYGDVDSFRFAMAQDGPSLTADGVLAMLREAVSRGMDSRDEE